MSCRLPSVSDARALTPVVLPLGRASEVTSQSGPQHIGCQPNDRNGFRRLLCDAVGAHFLDARGLLALMQRDWRGGLGAPSPFFTSEEAF
jgi:hypothetical protein